MKVKNIYLKKFSQILNLQEESTVQYSLCKSEDSSKTIYGIDVNYIDGEDNIKVEPFKSVSKSKEVTLEILKYLYENAVRPEFFKDVVTDFLEENSCLKLELCKLA